MVCHKGRQNRICLPFIFQLKSDLQLTDAVLLVLERQIDILQIVPVSYRITVFADTVPLCIHTIHKCCARKSLSLLIDPYLNASHRQRSRIHFISDRISGRKRKQQFFIPIRLCHIDHIRIEYRIWK